MTLFILHCFYREILLNIFHLTTYMSKFFFERMYIIEILNTKLIISNDILFLLSFRIFRQVHFYITTCLNNYNNLKGRKIVTN